VVQFGILGPLEVRAGDELVGLGGRQQRVVLARLLVDARRVVSAGRLVEDVWDGRPPPSAGKILQKYVSGLRKLLPTPVLRTSGAGYVLDVDDDSLDARRFEKLVGRHEFTTALGLWRGDVLADLADLAFIAPERARLEELRLFAIESRIESELASGRPAAVIAELGNLVDAYPLREGVTGLLMLALYRTGRQVEALRTYDTHRRRLADDIGVDPAAGLRELQLAILRHDPSLDPPRNDVVARLPARGRLPLALTSFIGRGVELGALARALSEHRLVTLTGPGGVGKTRLAIEFGRCIADRFPGGLWLVDLAGVQSPALVAMAIASALSINTRHAPDELTAVVAGLARQPPCLVVLDNCEHVVGAVASAAVTVLAGCDDLRIVATSRHPLGVDGEFIRPIQPLPEGDAVQLFAERARLAAAGSEVPIAQAQEICRQLDGLPLAIELAASQLRVLHADEIVDRLADHLTFRRPATNPSPRQRTLADMVRWSYGLLAPPVQRTFARLGGFASSFTLGAAESVCAVGDTRQADVLGHMTALVDHSLLVRDDAATASSRYRLLETLRLFALDRLAEAGDVDRTARAHVEYFLALASEHGPRLFGPDEVTSRLRLETEEPNLHAALDWAKEHDAVLALRLGVALRPYWEARWRERDGIPYLEAVLERAGYVDDGVRVAALTALAVMGANGGEARQAISRAVEAVDAYRRLGDELGLADALAALGSALGNQGRLDEADAAVNEGLTLARRLDDGRLTGRLLDMAGFVASRRGDHVRAVQVSREELAAWRRVGSRRGEATALRHIAVSIQHLGDHDEATNLCQQAVDIWRDVDDPAAVAHVQNTLADIARVRGDLAGAVEMYHTALAELQAIGDRRCTASTYKNLAAIAARRGQHTHAAGLLRQSLRLRHELGDEAGLAEVLEGLAGVDSAGGRDNDAVTLLAAAAAVRARTGSVASPEEARIIARALDTRRERLGDDGFDASYRRGRLMSIAEIVELALR
jgi:predicted ATPase/DNA-binding SARP family transcriptional activator